MTYFRDLPPHVQDEWRRAWIGNPERGIMSWQSPFDRPEGAIDRAKAAYVAGRIDVDQLEDTLERELAREEA